MVTQGGSIANEGLLKHLSQVFTGGISAGPGPIPRTRCCRPWSADPGIPLPHPPTPPPPPHRQFPARQPPPAPGHRRFGAATCLGAALGLPPLVRPLPRSRARLLVHSRRTEAGQWARPRRRWSHSANGPTPPGGRRARRQTGRCWHAKGVTAAATGGGDVMLSLGACLPRAG